MCTSAKIVAKRWVLIEGESEREVCNTVGNHIHVCISQRLLNNLEVVKGER